MEFFPEMDLLAEDGIFIVETDTDANPLLCKKRPFDTRVYGRTKFLFFGSGE
jgi:hypothetical protein